MSKKTRRHWQSLGFRNFREYQRFKKKKKILTMFEKCLQEASNCHQVVEKKRQQESADRQKYHEMRLAYLAEGEER